MSVKLVTSDTINCPAMKTMNKTTNGGGVALM